MKIRFFTQVGDLLGQSEAELAIQAPWTVLEVMRQLSQQFGEPFNKIFDSSREYLDDAFFMLLNGIHLARLQGLDTTVQDGDVLAIVPVTDAG